jgi:hypothetical protein
VHAFFGCEDP